MDIDASSTLYELLSESPMPCQKRRRRAPGEVPQLPAAAAPGAPAGDGAAPGDLGRILSCNQCSICLEALEVEPKDGEPGAVVRLECGHHFHGGRCLAPFIEAQYQSVQKRVEAELHERFDALGLAHEDRQSIFGSNFVEMLRHGQLRQCPRCRYGPVLNTHCRDLQAHDRERGQGTDRTTNECPTCGFFSASWSDWAIWDPEDFAAAARCPLCREPCKLSSEDINQQRSRLAEIDCQLSRADLLCWFSPTDLSTLLCYLQAEARLDVLEAGNFFEELSRGSSEDLAMALLQGPILDLVRQRLAVEERAARRTMSDRAQRSASADDCQALAQRLLVDFETAEGFDGSACAAELQTVFPNAVAEVLAEIRDSREMSEGAMVSALAGLLESEPAGKEDQQEGGGPDGDVLLAIHTVQQLLPSEKRFHAALARQDVMRAMDIAESLKPTLEGVLRQLVAGNDALLESLRPLRWVGNGFTTLPDLTAVLRVLHGQVPWPHMASSVANYVALNDSVVPAADQSAAQGHDFFAQNLHALLQSALSSEGATASARPNSLDLACQDLRDRQGRLELLLSTSREKADAGLTRRLAQVLQRRAISEPPAQCSHGQLLREVLLRYAKLCTMEMSPCDEAATVALLFASLHHMTVMAVREVSSLGSAGERSDRAWCAVRDLQRRASNLQGLPREHLLNDRERMAIDDDEASGKPPLHRSELQKLIREHAILLMHRILACAAALER